MNIFDIYWLDGTTTRITGNSIVDACDKAGIGGGCARAMDYWKEVKELPLEEKIILLDGDEPQNPVFIDTIRKFMSNTPKIGDIVEINIGRKYVFKLKYIKMTGNTVMFKETKNNKAHM